MISYEQLALFLQASAQRCRHEITEATKKHMAFVAKEAQSLIGQELGEWNALAEPTVSEKQKLGFTGHVSATDPLLRKGGLRDSIKAEAHETSEGAEGVVGSESRIALYQEHGTSRIPPRPFLAPALQHAEHHAEKLFGELAVRLTNPESKATPE